jgi:anti-sigma regulatory factor (Ser/Thr protein kinase)
MTGGNGVVEQALLRRSAHLDPVPASAGEARRVVRHALADAGESEAVYAAEVAVSELVTNAILHAATPLELTVEVTDTTVVVSVRDLSPRMPTQRHWSDTATTGRGLKLVRAMTDQFGVDSPGDAGKAVWFRLARHTPAAEAPSGAATED